MERKSNLKRTQSLRSVDEPTWTAAGLRNKITSVSQLVARYQTTVKVSTSLQDISVNDGAAKPKQALREKTPSFLESEETRLESLMRRNDARGGTRDKLSLTRSKSMGSLQSSARSIGALKALFETKAATENKVTSSFRAVSFSSPNETADIKPAVNREVEDVKSSAEEPKIKIPADAPVNAAKTDAKDHVTRKVVKQAQMERRKTIGGIDFETIAASQADEKRRSIADFRDSSFNQKKEKLSVSVKAMSALYLSKAVPQDSTRSISKPAQGQSSESGRIKLNKFQPACREMCSACLKTVYPMEKITADKYIFHQTCFCCKQCKKKLSMYNYAPLYGEFYCIFHYQQLFRRKGNYDEGFGHAQHKNRWLPRNTAGVGSNETESEA